MVNTKDVKVTTFETTGYTVKELANALYTASGFISGLKCPAHEVYVHVSNERRDVDGDTWVVRVAYKDVE